MAGLSLDNAFELLRGVVSTIPATFGVAGFDELNRLKFKTVVHNELL